PVSFPSALSRNERGPRLEATSTRPHGSAFMTVRLTRAGLGSSRRDRLECRGQLHKAHPEGWRERPCEAPATTTHACRPWRVRLLATTRPAPEPAALVPGDGPRTPRYAGAARSSYVAGANSGPRPATAAGTDEGERPRPCEYHDD